VVTRTVARTVATSISLARTIAGGGDSDDDYDGYEEAAPPRARASPAPVPPGLNPCSVPAVLSVVAHIAANLPEPPVVLSLLPPHPAGRPSFHSYLSSLPPSAASPQVSSFLSSLSAASAHLLAAVLLLSRRASTDPDLLYLRLGHAAALALPPADVAIAQLEDAQGDAARQRGEVELRKRGVLLRAKGKAKGSAGFEAAGRMVASYNAAIQGYADTEGNLEAMTLTLQSQVDSAGVVAALRGARDAMRELNEAVGGVGGVDDLAVDAALERDDADEIGRMLGGMAIGGGGGDAEAELKELEEELGRLPDVPAGTPSPPPAPRRSESREREEGGGEGGGEKKKGLGPPVRVPVAAEYA
jgi:hypothetical protein